MHFTSRTFMLNESRRTKEERYFIYYAALLEVLIE